MQKWLIFQIWAHSRLCSLLSELLCTWVVHCFTCIYCTLYTSIVIHSFEVLSTCTVGVWVWLRSCTCCRVCLLRCRISSVLQTEFGFSLFWYCSVDGRRTFCIWYWLGMYCVSVVCACVCVFVGWVGRWVRMYMCVRVSMCEWMVHGIIHAGYVTVHVYEHGLHGL